MIQNMMTKRHKESMKKYGNSTRKFPKYEHDNQLKFHAVNFDVNTTPILKDVHLNQTEVQYCMTIPDIKSFVILNQNATRKVWMILRVLNVTRNIILSTIDVVVVIID